MVVLAENRSRPTPNANHRKGAQPRWTRKGLADFLCDAALVKRFTEFARRVDLVKRVTEFVRDAAVVAVIQSVADGENQCDWPVDDLSGSQHSKADVVREFVRPGKVDLPDDGQIDGHGFSLTDALGSPSVRCCALLCAAPSRVSISSGSSAVWIDSMPSAAPASNAATTHRRRPHKTL